ncbi:UxaA family hydrolase [Buttiauxella gaviniae]|uniref:UxaA family hydrolase n=1 Tax=Buttiauxella gaviniae TaxID=82990 RepID=A0ABV3NWS1_9ENTR
MKNKLLQLHPQDNCLVALADIHEGEKLSYEGGELLARSNVTLGHKLAMHELSAGDKVIKYGAIIGSATQYIAVGEHIHSHNLKSDYIAVFHHQDAGYQNTEDQTT